MNTDSNSPKQKCRQKLRLPKKIINRKLKK